MRTCVSYVVHIQCLRAFAVKIRNFTPSEVEGRTSEIRNLIKSPV
jgi:hypothetical protein